MREDVIDQRHAELPALGEVSDAWLVGRSGELIDTAHQSDGNAKDGSCQAVGKLLAEAQRRGEPTIVAQILRAAAIVHLAAPGMVECADPLLDELLAHTHKHGLVVLEADAHALHARRALISNNEDAALTETATALAMLEQDLEPDVLLGRRTWERLLANALQDIGLVLTQLGVHEQADEVMARAHRHIWASGGPYEISMHLINRVRLLLGWALRLERAGRTAEAKERFATGSAIADSVAALWPESMFRGDHNRAAAEQVPALGAAHALAKPGAEHIGNLEYLLHQSFYPRERALVVIALSRCLESDGRVSEAVGVLGSARKQLAQEGAEPTARLSLVREYARLSRLAGQDAGIALRHYAAALEAELWALREARVATLEARREHERLAREHGAITRQAKQDPLTGLANRRELDERLEALISTPAARPLSVALVDLDGFKVVNDRCSHAEGDKVLQTVARTLREALRVDDVVARYGGDEFVVLLPRASLLAASAALERAAEAVAGLHEDLAHGVTLSVGAVSARPQESANQVLSRADKAMYQAKRGGGNRVAAPGLR